MVAAVLNRGDPVSLGHWSQQQTQYGVRGEAILGDQRANYRVGETNSSGPRNAEAVGG